MKTVYVHFSNHFDLVWRRCWDRDYVYQGGRYASYRRIEELCLLRNVELAEHGEGAYAVEQGLTMRAFLERHPEALPRLKALYEQGLFEVCGAGEAIIDVNLCSFETMCRNLASGVHYCRTVLGMPPLLANHGDGFGSSAQFPQVIRQCGLPGINGLSYSAPDNQYWRGLDGSTVLVWGGAPGRGYFFDHCYHEPCRACRGETPADCARRSSRCRPTALPEMWRSTTFARRRCCRRSTSRRASVAGRRRSPGWPTAGARRGTSGISGNLWRRRSTRSLPQNYRRGWRTTRCRPAATSAASGSSRARAGARRSSTAGRRPWRCAASSS